MLLLVVTVVVYTIVLLQIMSRMPGNTDLFVDTMHRKHTSKQEAHTLLT